MVVRAPIAELQAGRLAEHGDQRRTARAAQNPTHRRHSQGGGSEPDQRRRTPHHGGDDDSRERGHDQGQVEPPRRPVAEADGQRAFARGAVSGDVAQVVDDEQGAGDEPGGASDDNAQPGDPLDAHVRRADRGHEAEEHEHEQLAEAEVAVRPRAAGVSPRRGDAQRADHQQPPRRRGGEDEPGRGCRGERTTAPPVSPPRRRPTRKRRGEPVRPARHRSRARRRRSRWRS